MAKAATFYAPLYAMFLAYSLLSPCLAQEQTPPATEDPAETGNVFQELDEQDLQPEVENKPFFSFLDTPHGAIASGFHTFVKATDEFFANEQVFYDYSGSYIKLTSSVTSYEAGQRGYDSSVKVKARLPVTQKKISLLLESDPGEDEEEINKGLAATPQQQDNPTQSSAGKAIDEDSYYAGVEATHGKKSEWQLKPSLGVKVRSPLDYYARLRLTREHKFDSAIFNFKQAVYWFDSSGWESDTSAEFSLPVLQDVLFRSTTGANWTETNDYFDLRQVFSLTHKLSERRGISYQVGAYGISDPTIHNTHYLASVHYRQNLHADYFFMDIIPQALYRKENAYEAEYSITLRLEMVFKG